MKRKICLILFIVIVGTMFLTACSKKGDLSASDQETEIKNEELNKLKKRIASIDKEYEGSYKLPIHPQYPILHVFLAKPPIPSMPPDMVIYYGLDKGELHELFKEEKQLALYEKSREEDVLYGYYEGNIMAEVSYYPIKGGKVDGKNTWKFNDIEVSYEILTQQDQKQYIITGIDQEKGGYWIRYHITDTFGEDEAREFTEFLLNELN